MVESHAVPAEGSVNPTLLSDLLSGVDAEFRGPSNLKITGVAYRSNDVRPGDVFFCVPGFAHDGHDFAADAVERGAVALVCQRELALDVTQCLVPDARIALALGAASYYGRPSAAMQVVGITGTNGKTTTTYLVDAIMRAAGRRTGIVGTVETRIGSERVPAKRTTPESSDLQALFARMREEAVDAVAIEVSSHAIDLHRVDGVEFAAVAFTNLTQDHLDYHATMEEYFAVKRRLFTDFPAGARVVNVDDPVGSRMASEIADAITVGTSESASVRAERVELRADSSTFELVAPAGRVSIELPLAGAYNVSNALVAAGCALGCGVALETIRAGLESAPQVPGRLERVDAGQPFTVVVDYAHTPDSLEKALAAMRAVTPGRVIVVFGCGGDRDPAKRPLMGAAAGRGADLTIVTSDNPRSEDPVGIILQVEDGLRPLRAAYEVEVDRRRAIARALKLAEPGDCVLVAGKGHEDYQIFAEQTIHFDDREVVREELAASC